MNKEKFAFITLILGIAAFSGLIDPLLLIWPISQLIFIPFVLSCGILGLKSKRKNLTIIGIILFLIAFIAPMYFF